MNATKNSLKIKRFDRINSVNRDGVTIEILVVENVLNNGLRYQVVTLDGEVRPDIWALNTYLAVDGWKTDQLTEFNAKYA